MFGENWVDLAGAGADPLVPDVFVEIDCMPGFCPTAAEVQGAVDVFAAATRSARSMKQISMNRSAYLPVVRLRQNSRGIE